MHHHCPVCGYPKLLEAPRTKASGGSYEICPSCGFQFGVSDEDDGFTYEKWRARWIAAGLPWSSQQKPPRGWNPEAQLATLPNK